MSVWFEGANDVECDIQRVKRSLEDLGEHYVGVIKRMPGLTSVELVEQGSGFVVIKTNEGVMTRENIIKRTDADAVVVEFDEEYKAGSKITTKGHFVNEFKSSDAGVSHRTIISELEAPGFLGFFYRHFGSSSIGKALLNSYKTYLESSA